MKPSFALFILATCQLLTITKGTTQSFQYVLLDSTDDETTRVHKASRVVPSSRQLTWQQLELTAFFHFGINTFTNREWGDGKEDPKLFNPSELDAMQWVKTAKEAGIRQVILTAKHHDGFCLWPSRYTRHSVAASPWKNGNGDVVKEVSEACKALGVGFGVYLSPWDRNSPLYGTDAYNDYFAQQLTELLTEYGAINEVWFDGANGEGPNGKKQVYDFNRWYSIIRSLQPQATIAIMGPDVRWVGTESGHGRETEWSVVPADNLDAAAIAANSQQDLAFKPSGDMMGNDLGSREKIMHAKALVWYPAETDVSIRPGWFYHESEDAKVKTPEQLLDIYFHSVGRNGVLLLNIPPDKRGLIHEADIAALSAWKQRIDQIFAHNLAAQTTSIIPPFKWLTDNDYATSISLAANDGVAMEWPGPQTFNVLSLQENIRYGQQIEGFVLEYKDGSEWKIAAKGTTVGYKRLMRFNTVTARQVRLTITGARNTVHLATIGLYLNSF